MALIDTLPRLPDNAAKGCDFWDVTCKTKQAINGWLADVARSAISWTFNNIGSKLLSTPDLDSLPRVATLTDRSVLIANTCFVILIIVGGLIVMGHENIQTSYTVKDIAPRLVLGFILANVSGQLIPIMIDIANGLSGALIGPGVDPDAALKFIGARFVLGEGATASSFTVLMFFAVAILAVLLGIVVALRITLVVLLVIAAPLALVCHALPQTESIAQLWWRAIAGVLAIQVAHALVFTVLTTIMFTPDANALGAKGQLWDMLLLCCLLYVMIRIPSWISTQIFNGGQRKGPVQRAARIAAYRLLLK